MYNIKIKIIGLIYASVLTETKKKKSKVLISAKLKEETKLSSSLTRSYKI